jgi:predicted nucleotidyltransferase
MEKVDERLTPNQKIFLNNLKQYINGNIYLYGSILRPDFIKEKSDIDIDIFSDNEISTVYKICDLLNLKRNNFKKIVYKIDKSIVYGYKCKYSSLNEGIEVEISIYNEKYKNIVLKDHNKDITLPFYITISLIIIKFLFYNLQVISKKVYSRCKRFLMNENDELKFIELDN